MKSQCMTMLFPTVLLLVGCVPDRDLIGEDPIVTGGDSASFNVSRHSLFINEFVARGSENVNEFGSAEDWFEVYNPHSFNAVLEAGRWFVTDKGPEDPKKFELPQCTIPAKGFLLIWCDGLGIQDVFIHTNFSLSASGEHIGIYYENGELKVMVDDHEYPAQEQDAVSTGRYPDGGPSWVTFQNPTPGSSNN